MYSQKKLYKVFSTIWGKNVPFWARRSFSKKLLLSAFFTCITQSFYKASPSCLDKVLRTRCTSFMIQFQAKMAHFRAQKSFFKIFTIVINYNYSYQLYSLVLAPLFNYIALALCKISKILRMDSKNQANELFEPKIG